MYGDAFVNEGFVKIIFYLPDSGAKSSPGSVNARPDDPDADCGAATSALGITAELQECRNNAVILRDAMAEENTKKLLATLSPRVEQTQKCSAYDNRAALGITAELQELRDIAGILRDTMVEDDADKFSSILMPKVKQTQKVPTGLLQVPTGLLTSSSPIFATMLEQGWRESHERCIPVENFCLDDFRVFLDCLYALANETFGMSITVIDKPKLLRQVLPIAHYYQVDDMKKTIFESVLLPESLQKKSVVEVAELVLAVESSLPEEEVPDWPTAVLQGLNYYFKCLKQDYLNDPMSKACIEDLSLKTLRKVLAAPDRFDQFVDHFLHNLEWDDLHKPTTSSVASLKQTSSGPQYVQLSYSNSGKTVKSEQTIDILWKENLRSAFNKDREKQREQHLSLSLEDSVLKW